MYVSIFPFFCCHTNMLIFHEKHVLWPHKSIYFQPELVNRVEKELRSIPAGGRGNMITWILSFLTSKHLKYTVYIILDLYGNLSLRRILHQVDWFMEYFENGEN